MSKQKILVPEWWLQKKYTEYCEWAVLHEAVPLSYELWLGYTEYTTM